MNILAHLQFGDHVSALYHKDYLVVGCHTHLMRGYNAYHPNTTPTCESFEVTVVQSQWTLAVRVDGCAH